MSGTAEAAPLFARALRRRVRLEEAMSGEKLASRMAQGNLRVRRCRRGDRAGVAAGRSHPVGEGLKGPKWLKRDE